MAETKWTKGPWEASDTPDGGNGGDPGCYGVREVTPEYGAGYVIADVWSDVEELEPHAKANARLIASAPDLYAALESVLPFIDDANDVQQFFPDSACSDRCRAAVAACHAALKKARGE